MMSPLAASKSPAVSTSLAWLSVNSVNELRAAFMCRSLPRAASTVCNTMRCDSMRWRAARLTSDISPSRLVEDPALGAKDSVEEGGEKDVEAGIEEVAMPLRVEMGKAAMVFLVLIAFRYIWSSNTRASVTVAAVFDAMDADALTRFGPRPLPAAQGALARWRQGRARAVRRWALSTTLRSAPPCAWGLTR